MGGTVNAWGNIDLPTEFNFMADPEAAAIVYNKMPYIHLNPWETCERCVITPERVKTLESDAESHPLVEVFKGMNKIYNRPNGSVDCCDGICLAAAIDPSIVTKSRESYGRVETKGEMTQGAVFFNMCEFIPEG